MTLEQRALLVDLYEAQCGFVQGFVGLSEVRRLLRLCDEAGCSFTAIETVVRDASRGMPFPGEAF